MMALKANIFVLKIKMFYNCFDGYNIYNIREPDILFVNFKNLGGI